MSRGGFGDSRPPTYGSQSSGIVGESYGHPSSRYQDGGKTFFLFHHIIARVIGQVAFIFHLVDAKSIRFFKPLTDPNCACEYAQISMKNIPYPKQCHHRNIMVFDFKVEF